MTRYSRVLVALTLAVAGCGPATSPAPSETARTLPFYDSPDFTPRWPEQVTTVTHRIRPFRLVDQTNAPFTEVDLQGRIAVVDFFFTTCPAICPLMAKSMGAVQEAFMDDDRVVLISHSVTPDTDTPDVLASYAARHAAHVDKWKLLTGPKSEIYDLGRRYYFVDEDLGATRDDNDFLHTENFILIDGARRIRGIYNGLDPDSIRALIADIEVLKREPAADPTP